MGSLAGRGLRRHRSVPRNVRQQASFWTSAFVVVVLFILQVVWQRVPSGDEAFLKDAPIQLSAEPRRLISDVYPSDLLLKKPYYEDPNRWLVILHCIVIGYMLIGLNTVCDAFFTGALEFMVSEWNITPDVAGATLMAAGGSAPELFTSLIGVAVESDVGFSTIVGSAVFNVLFVIGLCGCAAKDDMKLSWWPLFRDCSYYILSLMVLAIFCYDRKVELYEALLLFFAYLLYILIMYNNSKLEGFVNKNKKDSMTKKKVVPLDSYAVTTESNDGQATKKTDDEESKGQDPEATPEVTPVAAEKDKAEGKEEEEEPEEDDFWEFMEKPDNTRDLIIWGLCMPIYFLVSWVIPRPTKSLFTLTFALSLVWIAIFAFVLVWCVEIVGDVIFRGDAAASVVMGFTILAAGTSIPDAVSSVAVARAGEGDMAVSSSIGSNIFDILFGLPVPWIIKILAQIGGTSYVSITSHYIFFYVLLLLFMVFLTITCIHLVGWKLNKHLGLCMALLYGVFLAIALTVEFSEPSFLRWS